jgi:hypothetical protein
LEVGLMMCKEASMIVSTSEPPAELGRRLASRLHLAICPYCRTFRRQIQALGTLAQESSAGYESEPGADFEAQIVRSLARAEHDS